MRLLTAGGVEETAAVGSLASAQQQYGGFTNIPLVAAFISFMVAQSLKVLTTWFKENRWDVKRLYGSGGMPSSHTATVMGLACAVGLREGLGGSLFAISFVLASVVMYDASGVRLQAGRQAEVLNQIVFELPPEHPLSDSRPLKEFLGHTPPQVAAGAMLGCFIAFFLHLLSLLSGGLLADWQQHQWSISYIIGYQDLVGVP